jgi:hypothetical protein
MRNLNKIGIITSPCFIATFLARLRLRVFIEYRCLSEEHTGDNNTNDY